ncbi:MAG: CotH kinase family protein [Candidatus Poribacteria bacterium]|nr:CotH kinase family protein [Candidatus Poribacteria bacterium]
MYLKKKIILMFLGSIILAIVTGCITDTTEQPNQPSKISNLKRTDTDQKLDRTKAFTSNLPIVIIDTSGGWIRDEPKIPAAMKIIYDESGGRNTLNSQHIDFEGKIGIELRGKTSLGFPKKQYGVEIQDEEGNDKDASLLQLPAESDWVLNGPYWDKTLMRNYLAYEFSNRIGRYASRTKFVEVFLNERGDATIGDKHYVGVYLLIEKIKRGKDRVDIKSLKPANITGGYILKIDKMDRYETYFFTRSTRLFYVYPKGYEMSAAQKAWIQNYMSEFEAALAGKDFKDPERGYAKYIDTDAFIDHFIINELFRNIDGFRNSTYMYKDRDSKLTMGPIWDFNLSMGNAGFNDGWKTDGWLIYTNPVPFWWDRLLQDKNFTQKLAKRWEELRKDILATSKLLDAIDQTAEYLSEAQQRDYQRWASHGHNAFGSRLPTNRGRLVYEQEIQQIKRWLQARLKWIDTHIASPRKF